MGKILKTIVIHNYNCQLTYSKSSVIVNVTDSTTTYTAVVTTLSSE